MQTAEQDRLADEDYSYMNIAVMYARRPSRHGYRYQTRTRRF
ncbi:hypothetical protein O9992_02540 [Vibrio lentus]|nr:hypothetical protein [Vibrio lentus]